MAHPSISQVSPTSENWYRSQQVTEALLLYPEVYKDLVSRFGEQDFNLNSLSRQLGGVNFINNMEFRHSEEDYLHEALMVEANSSGYAANVAGTYTIASNYQYEFPADGIASPFITEGVGGNPTNTVPLYANQIIQFPSGVQAIVYSVNASAGTFVAYPRVSGESMPDTTTTDYIIILGNQVGEGADINPSRDSQLIWYFNNMSNMNGSYKATGNAKAEIMWMDTSKGKQWFFVGAMNESKRLKNEREFRIWTDTKTTNTTFANLDTTTTTNISFEGLIPFVESYGNQLPYNLVSGVTLQDFEDLVGTQLVSVGAASEYAVYSGTQLMLMVSRFQRAEGKNGGIVYAALGREEDYTVKYNFTSFKVGGISFHFRVNAMQDYKPVMGAVGQPYPYMGIGIPLSKSDKSVTWDDMTSTKNTPEFMIHFQKYGEGGRTREWEEWKTGGADGTYTNTLDVTAINWRSTFGFEGFCPNKYFKVFKQ